MCMKVLHAYLEPKMSVHRDVGLRNITRALSDIRARCLSPLNTAILDLHGGVIRLPCLSYW